MIRVLVLAAAFLWRHRTRAFALPALRRVASRLVVLGAIFIAAAACWLGGCSPGSTRAQSESSPPLAYVGSWGVRGDGPGQLEDPACIATDSVGNVYIADAGSHFINKFDPRGTPLLSYQDEKLRQPQSIAVDAGGAIYVTDSSRQSAFVYFPNGDRYHQLRLSIRPGREDTLSIAVDDDGMIHILDDGAGRVFNYTPNFRLLQTWQPAAQEPPGKTRAASLAAGPDGYLYLADRAGSRILRFTREGRFVDAIGASADGTDRRLSGQVAVSRKYLFVMDTDGRMLHVWSLDGRLQTEVDLAPELGQGRRPAPALAVSPHQELLVLDAPGARVLHYRIQLP